MANAARFLPAALLTLGVAFAPAHAQNAGRSAHGALYGSHACLNQKERRAAVEKGTVIRLAKAFHAVRARAPGTLVRARLCRRRGGLVYLLTVLARDGRVRRVAVDAVKGTVLGER